MPYRPQQPNKPLLHDLLASQKFEIEQAIVEFGFEKAEFQYTVAESQQMHDCSISVLLQRGTKNFFAFDFLEHEISNDILRYSTHRPGKETSKQTLEAGSWSEQLDQVREWLAFIKRETDPASYQALRDAIVTPDPPQSSVPSDTSALAIFISHSSVDATMAEALADLLRNALSIPPEKIRCTSALAYSLPFGVDTIETVRTEVSSAAVVVGLITASSTESHWVLFELGARWGQGKPLFSVLAGGADVSLLPAPIRGRHALKVTGAAPVVKFVEELASQLQIARPESWRYGGFVEKFIAHSPTPKAGSGNPIDSAQSSLDVFKKGYR